MREYDKKIEKIFTIYFIFLLLSTMVINVIGTSSAVMYIGYSIAFAYLAVSILSIRFTIRKIYVQWGMTLLITGLITLFLNSEHIYDSIRSAGLNINLIIPALYIFMIGVVAKKRLSLELIDKILLDFSYISVLVSVITVLVNFEQIGRILSESTNAYSVALKGFFPNKNMFGDFAAIGTAISVYCASVKKRLTNIVIVVFQFIITVLTLSRAALLYLAVFVLVFGLFAFVRKFRGEYKVLEKMYILAALCMLCAVFAYMKSENIQIFVMNKVLRIDVGDAGRSSIHEEAFGVMKQNKIQNWLFGYGPSGLDYLINSDVHNTYLNILLIGGITRLIIFIIGIVCSFYTSWKSREHILSSFCLSCLCAYLIFTLFETVVYFELGLFSFEILFVILFIPLCVSYDSTM